MSNPIESPDATEASTSRQVSGRVAESGDVIAIHDRSVLYFAIPKVANSSMKALCADLIWPTLDGRLAAEYAGEARKHRLFWESRARERLRRRHVLLRKREVAAYQSYWKFCFVRNPWDRLVSCWRSKIKSQPLTERNYVRGVARTLADDDRFYAGMSFGAFTEAVAETPDEQANRHYRSQFTFVTGKTGSLLVDFVGRFEALEEDFARVREHLGSSCPDLPHFNRSDRRDYADYFDQRTRDLVTRRYAHDVELFGYEF